MAWISAGLAAVCLALGLVHLVRLVVLRIDVLGEASHAAMGFGMAAMFSPLGDPVPAPVWIVVFGLAGAWFGAVALRARSLCGKVGHHVVGSAAMLFMLVNGHGAVPDGGGGHAGHAVHGGGPEGGLGLGSVTAIVLAGYFVWHVLRCSDRWRSARTARSARSAEERPPGTGATAVATRLAPAVLLGRPAAAAAHLVMAGLMAVMLLGMV